MKPFEVFNLRDVSKRRMSAIATLAMPNGVPDGMAIREAQYNMARDIAQMIVESDSFFKSDTSPGFVHYRADAVILTIEEYAQLCHTKFSEGVRHSQGFVHHI